jgi:signal transduction histidine kinase
MRERAELMRGTFALRPAPGGGLVVSVRVPIVAKA